MENVENEIRKSFAQLSALKKNLPNTSEINEKYVKIFHKEIGRLVILGYKDLEEFKIPENEITPRPTFYSPETGTEYSDEKFVDRELMLMQLDAVLTFFQLGSEKIEAGFQSRN